MDSSDIFPVAWIVSALSASNESADSVYGVGAAELGPESMEGDSPQRHRGRKARDKFGFFFFCQRARKNRTLQTATRWPAAAGRIPKLSRL
jgi:hypothetical protein